MAYIKSYPSQNYLIPPKITDLFSKNHVCYLIEQIANEMDYSEFDQKYAGAGHPAYHPRINLKLLAMASVDSMRSSRRIAKNAQENVVHIYLAEKTQPDFRTISDFRKDNPELVEQFVLQLSRFAHENGLIDLSHLMVDGTTIRANANNNKILDKTTIEKLRRYIRKEIERGIKVDEEEDRIYGERGLHQLPEDLNTSEKRRPVVRKIVDEINKAIKENKTETIDEIDKNLEKLDLAMEKQGLKKYSLIDPDSRFMLNKKGKIELNYNAQLVVDKSGIIVSNDVVQQVDERHQLVPMINKVEQDFGQLPEDKVICTDGLYLSPDIVELDQRGYELLMPTYGMQKHEKGKFDKVNFKYDQENDTYTCPENKILTNRGTSIHSQTKRSITIYAANFADCQACPHRQACCKNAKKKVITALPHDKLINKIKDKMQTEEGRALYKLRQQTVETAFGDIKHNKKFRDFLLRGIGKVKIEFNLVCLAHNFVMINNLMKKRRVNLATGC